MAEIKTKKTELSVEAFLDTKVTDEATRKDCDAIIAVMEKATGHKARMWGPAIIGFDEYHYKYESGHAGNMCAVGFSPRVGKLSFYIKASAPGQKPLLAKLGKFKASKGCVYVNKASDIDLDVLGDVVKQSVKYVKGLYPEND